MIRVRLRLLRSECFQGRLNKDPIALDDGAILHVPSDDAPYFPAAPRRHARPPALLSPPRIRETTPPVFIDAAAQESALRPNMAPRPSGLRILPGENGYPSTPPPQNAMGEIFLLAPRRPSDLARIPKEPEGERATDFANAANYPFTPALHFLLESQIFTGPNRTN